MSMSLVPSLALQELKENFYKKFCKQHLIQARLKSWAKPTQMIGNPRMRNEIWSKS